MMWYGGMGAGGWLLMTLVTLGFWALVVFGVVALFRGSRDSGARTDGRLVSEAEHVLEERLARGEIDVAEFQARRAALRSH